MAHTTRTGENEDEYAGWTGLQRAVVGENSAPPPSRNMTSEPRAEIIGLVRLVRVGCAGWAPLSGPGVSGPGERT